MIDELHLELPFMGARQLSRQLDKRGLKAGRVHVRTLMPRMGIEALAPQPGASERKPQHKVYPYLLRKLAIVRSKQVWRRTLPTSAWRGALCTSRRWSMSTAATSWRTAWPIQS